MNTQFVINCAFFLGVPAFVHILFYEHVLQSNIIHISVMHANGRHGESPRHKTPIDFWVETLRKTGTGKLYIISFCDICYIFL